MKLIRNIMERTLGFIEDKIATNRKRINPRVWN